MAFRPHDPGARSRSPTTFSPQIPATTSTPSTGYAAGGANLQANKMPDAPPIFFYKRGSRQLALEIAADPARRAEAVSTLEGMEYASKTRQPRHERAELWKTVLRACGYDKDAPLSIEMLRTGVAVLKAAGYRTAFQVGDQALVT